MSKPRKNEPQLGFAIRSRRKQLGLTLQALGEKAGVSVGYLSQVERDNATPSLGTLAQIATALDTGLEYFITSSKPSDGLSRANRRDRFSVAGSPVTYETIAAEYPGAAMSSYILNIPPHYTSETVSHEGEEVLFILEGRIEQTLDGEVIAMECGDSLHFNGSTPHRWKNPTDSPARVLWTGTLSVLHPKGIELT
ncbi:helix-turn-helix transcriptional regulator [Marivivens donghaensis]|uniref:Helix-turn-helix transcriptional regulator n=1 Tax=Marivivens donghaensis TaxID=1699413 RepID=A0ABX0W2S4_9RHOB|nr:XRE family transcriptional regulator [Marivivens donghaensis]NIY73930.1 helix-turn-helix transcriptional regulator [Marivivens donghaensis]